MLILSASYLPILLASLLSLNIESRLSLFSLNRSLDHRGILLNSVGEFAVWQLLLMLSGCKDTHFLDNICFLRGKMLYLPSENRKEENNMYDLDSEIREIDE